MTIQKIMDKQGNVLRYRTRVERKDIGVINRSFARQIDAERYLNDFNRKYPCGQPAWTNKGIRVKEVVIEIKKGRAIIINAPVIKMNGCTLERSHGRCKPMDKCRHYWDCLCAATDLGWPGWRVV